MNINYILSLGSNCEMSKMFEYNLNNINNVKIYKHLFSWSNISLKHLLILLENTDLFDIDTNYKSKFRFSQGHIVNNVLEFYDYSEFFDDIDLLYKSCNSTQYKYIHLDTMYYLNNDFIFYLHVIVKELPFFDINDSFNEYKSKLNYLIKNSKLIFDKNNINKKIFCIKILKDEVVIDDIIKLHNLLINDNDNNFMKIILESNDISLYLKNTDIVYTEQLTPHNEALSCKKYNTFPYYKKLFDNLNL